MDRFTESRINSEMKRFICTTQRMQHSTYVHCIAPDCSFSDMQAIYSFFMQSNGRVLIQINALWIELRVRESYGSSFIAEGCTPALLCFFVLRKLKCRERFIVVHVFLLSPLHILQDVGLFWSIWRINSTFSSTSQSRLSCFQCCHT